MTPKWKFDTIDAAIQALQRDKVSITAGRIYKRTGPSVTLDEIRQHVANRIDLPVRPRLIGPHAPSHKFAE